MANDKIEFLLDLDAAEFAGKVTDALDSIENLQKTLGKVAGVAGVVGAAYLAMKTSMELTLQAEELKSLEVQFNALAKSAGVAGDEILSGMEKASDGLIDTSDAMGLANKAMIQLGSSANRIPELMEIARKASVIFGTSTEEAFERITQAIATGQTRQLKQLGVIVDSEKAYRDYAASIGVASTALSEQGKIQAIASAAIPQLQNKLKDVDTTVRETTDSWTRLKIAINDIGEATAQTVGKSSAWKSIMDSFASMARSLSTDIKANFGAGKTEVDGINERIAFLNEELRKNNELLEKGTFWEKFFGEKSVDFLRGANEEIDQLNQRLQALGEGERTMRPRDFANVNRAADAPNVADSVDAEAQKKADDAAIETRRQAQTKYYADLRQIQEQNIQSRIQSEMDADSVMFNMQLQRDAVNAKFDQQALDMKNNKFLSEQQQADAWIQLEQSRQSQLAQIEESAEQRKLAALDRYAAASKNTADGIANAFAAGSARAQKSQNDFGAAGARVFQSFSNNASAAFVAFGAGQKSASEAAKGFLFGMLADEAFARGQIMFLSSIWPTNPAGLAGGAALMAFSGFLRSQASGAGGGTGGSTAVTSGGGITNSAASELTSAPEVREERERKALSIVINGSVFDSRETGMRIAEIIKETSDATDIRIS